jgi:chromosome segregation ATPase
MPTSDQSAPDLSRFDLARAEELGNHVRDAFCEMARAKHDASQDNARLKATLEGLQARLSESDSEHQQQQTALARMQAQLATSIDEGSRRQAEAEALRNQLSEVVDRSAETVRALHSANARSEELTRRNERQAAEVAQSASRISQQEAEIEDLRGQTGAIQGQLEAARSSQRELIQLLGDAARGDEALGAGMQALSEHQDQGVGGEQSRALRDGVQQLAARRRDLALKLERSANDMRQLREQLERSAAQAIELTAERDEIAASGKEVIARLTQQRDTRERELNGLRAEHEALGARAGVLEVRLGEGEDAVRHFAESMASLAAEESAVKLENLPRIEEQRLDLELTLSKLPQAGEEGVAQAGGLSMQLADGARLVAEALVARRRALGEALEASHQRRHQLEAELAQVRGEINAVRSAYEEREGAVRRYQAELAAVRKELGEQGQALAGKIQELGSARSDIASARAELGVMLERNAELERRSQQLNSQSAELRRELERTRSEHQGALAKAQQAENAQAHTVQALRSLTSRSDGSSTLARALTEVDFSDVVSKAGQKLDLATAQGGEQLAAASMAYAQALRDRLTTMVDDTITQRAELQSRSINEQQLNVEVTALKAAQVDRDHEIENLGGEIARAKEEQAKVLGQLMAVRTESDEIAAKYKHAQESLRLALAEIDDYRARGMAASGHFSTDNERLRNELEILKGRSEKGDQELAELRVSAEAAEARLRRQREEFTRRLEERDEVIQQKDRLLDQAVSERVDAKSLEAQLHAVSAELANANERLKEMEGVYGHNAGVTMRSGDLSRELKNVQGDRDQLRERLRDLESGLADAVSLSEQWRTQVDEKRKDMDALREKISRELGEERERSQIQREEFRKLKEEVVGLRARLRRLTDPTV